MKRTGVVCLLAVIVLLLPLMGCGSDTMQEGSDEKPFSFGDINWEIGEGVISGERYLVMDCVNNSDRTVIGVGIQFREKAGLTDEEKNEFWQQIKIAWCLDEEDLA
ncbi:MAG: hypothetical protein IKB34_00575, partial [Clostridia bacterium]|nr:hypothetical protein [Clostridia bacterium]